MARARVSRAVQDPIVALEAVDADGATLLAGPAGHAWTDLPLGVTVLVDYLDPRVLLRVEVERSATADTAQAELLAALVGPAAAAALVGSEAGADAGTEAAAGDSVEVEFEVGPALVAAGRLALLFTMLESSWRSVGSLWAAEAAGLARSIHPRLDGWADELVAAARPSLALLPADRPELFRANSAALAALLRAADRESRDPRLDALRDAVGGAEAATASSAAAVASALPVHLEERPPSTSRARGRASLVHGGDSVGHATLDAAVRVDATDRRPGLLAAAPSARLDGDDVRVDIELTEAAAAVPDLFLDRIRAVARDPEGRLLERSGFRFGGPDGVASATFGSWEHLPSGTWFDVTSGPRRAVVPPDVRLVEHAVAEGRRAADLERLAAAASGADRPSIAARTAPAWYIAARRWGEARRPAQEAAAVTRAKAAADAGGPPATAFDVERVAPAIRYWLGELDSAALHVDGLLAAEAVAEAVGDARRRVELALAAIERARRVPDGIDLDEVVWAAVATGDSPVVAKAAAAWSAGTDGDADDDADDDGG